MAQMLNALNQEAMYIAIVIRTILSAHSLGKEDKRTWTMNSGLTGSNRVSNIEGKHM